MADPREAQALKPCPLCGREPRRNGRGGAGGVLCVGDNATVGMIHRFQTYGADQAEADAAWERAATPADLEAVREAAAKVADDSAAYQETIGEGGGREWAVAKTIAAAIRNMPIREGEA